MIQRLGSDVISELRSGVALSSLAQCVEELVLNSIDAGSTNIIVDVDISTVSLEVSDNGTGVRQNDLKNIGQRYFTSKCHSIKDLENAASYGYRGEALVSLGTICQKVEIVSRHKASCRTFCKHVRKGQDMGVYESASLRPRHGTTVKAWGVFHTLPVRQKLISEKVDLEQIRRHVLAVVLMNPGVSFLVRNKENGTTLLQANACTSTLSVISQVFGCNRSKTFKPVSQTSGVYTITGYVSLEGFSNRNFQFFYVNKRLVLKTRFHNVANHILARAITGLIMAESSNQDEALCSPKKLDKYAGFVINLECPHNTYDITFDPEKTLVEFQNWEEPISCLKECLNDFLKKEGIFREEFCNNGRSLVSDTQEWCSSLSQESDSVKLDSEGTIEYPNVTKRPIRASDLRRSLYSSTAKRKRNELVVCSKELTCSSHDSGLGNTCSSNESSYVTSERDMDGKGRTEEVGLVQDCSFSSDELTTTIMEDISSHSNSSVTALNKVEKSSKRSIIAKLQKYSGIPRPSNARPSASYDCFFSPSEETFTIGHESVKSRSSKRKCLRTRQSEDPELQLNYSKTTKGVQQSENIKIEGRMGNKKECEEETIDCHDRRIDGSKEILGVSSNVDSSSILRRSKKTVNIQRESELMGMGMGMDVDCSDYSRESKELNQKSNDNSIIPKDIGQSGNKEEHLISTYDQTQSLKSTTNCSSVCSISDSSSATFKDNARMVELSTTTNTNDKSPTSYSEWLLQYNPYIGRPVYINLRTGNTSMVIPHCESEPTIPQLKKQPDSTKLRRFRKFASHLSHNFTPWLPRSISPSESSVSRGEEEQSSDIGDMLDQWINPVFERNEMPVADATFTDGSKTTMKLHSTAQPFKFTKDCFNKMKVISQVDNKFILCHYQGDGDNFLVVVDQHAAHERVRLETFTKDLYIDSQGPNNKMLMKSAPVTTPCKLSMSDHDIHLMQAFRTQLQQVAITFEDPRPSSSDIQSSVCIKTVPSVFLAREHSDDGEKLRTEIKTCIEDLIKEYIEVMLSTKGASTTALPKAVTKVLNSQACHGAIRFGDSLSIEECVNLMTSLSKCDLPFQCAHGRPSMIPLINTKSIQNGISKKVTSLPQIWKIRKRIIPKESSNKLC